MRRTAVIVAVHAAYLAPGLALGWWILAHDPPYIVDLPLALVIALFGHVYAREFLRKRGIE